MQKRDELIKKYKEYQEETVVDGLLSLKYLHHHNELKAIRKWMSDAGFITTCLAESDIISFPSDGMLALQEGWDAVYKNCALVEVTGLNSTNDKATISFKKVDGNGLPWKWDILTNVTVPVDELSMTKSFVAEIVESIVVKRHSPISELKKGAKRMYNDKEVEIAYDPLGSNNNVEIYTKFTGELLAGSDNRVFHGPSKTVQLRELTETQTQKAALKKLDPMLQALIMDGRRLTER